MMREQEFKQDNLKQYLAGLAVFLISLALGIFVFFFCVQDTIEEKVTDLSKRKRAIFDRVVLAGETELKSLTEEDIRALFFT